MSLFECLKCHAVDNTALTDYWMRTTGYGQAKGPALCSECSEGKWHGQFPKRTRAEAGYITGKDGFLHTPERG